MGRVCNCMMRACVVECGRRTGRQRRGCLGSRQASRRAGSQTGRQSQCTRCSCVCFSSYGSKGRGEREREREGKCSLGCVGGCRWAGAYAVCLSRKKKIKCKGAPQGPPAARVSWRQTPALQTLVKLHPSIAHARWQVRLRQPRRLSQTRASRRKGSREAGNQRSKNRSHFYYTSDFMSTPLPQPGSE